MPGITSVLDNLGLGEMVAPGPGLWQTWNDVIKLGAEALSRKRPSAETVERLERLARAGNVSTGTAEILDRVLRGLGYPEVADEHAAQFAAVVAPLRDITRSRDAGRAVLEGILRIANRVANDGSPQDSPPKLAELGKLMHGLNLRQCPITAWWVLGRRDDRAAVDVVLRSVAAALNVHVAELAGDAAWCLSQIDNDLSRMLDDLMPDAPAEPDWQRARGATLAVDDLVRSLEHPSIWIAWNGARLLAAGAGGNEAKRLIQDVLDRGHDQALEVIAAFAEVFWGGEALDRMLGRLGRRMWLGCRWLLEALPAMNGAWSDPRTRPALLRGLAAHDSRVASAAAGALSKLEDGAETLPSEQLREALARWTEQGARCDRCEIDVHEDSCPTCHVVPDSPRADLVRMLTRAGHQFGRGVVAVRGRS